MNRSLVLAAAAALLATSAACRSAFAPEPVLKIAAPPSAQAPATSKIATVIRSGPDGAAHVLEALPAGASVTASEQVVRGFRRVRTAEGKTGYVDATALELGAAAPVQAAPAAPAPAPSAAEPQARPEGAPAASPQG